MKIFITGIPHSGKTAVFEQIASGAGQSKHYLNGSDLHVNYFSKIWKQTTLEFFDLPGFENLEEKSEAAEIIKLALNQEKPDRIVHVLSSQNFSRQLKSLLLVLEWGIPVILVANAGDETSGVSEVNWKLLSESFQTPVHNSPLSHRTLRKSFYENIIRASQPRLSQRQKNNPEKLLEEFVTPHPFEALPWPKVFSESFYKHWAFFPITLIVFTVLILTLNRLVFEFYGIWMERTLMGRYVHSFLEAIFKALNVPGFIQDIFIGNYGLLTLGLAYALAFVFPVLLCTYLLLNTLSESNYLDHLKVWFIGLLKNLRLPENYFHIGLTGLGCNLVAIQNIKSLQNPHQKFLGLLFLMLGVPCAAQSLILGNVLLGIHPFLFGFILILILLQAGFLGWILARNMKVPPTGIIIQPQQLRKPHMRFVWQKTLRQIKFAIPSTLSLLLISALALSLLDITGLLQLLRSALSPFLGYAFGLPPETTDVFLIGFFRRDFGAVGLYNLTNQGNLNAVQTVVCLSLITFFYPCFASMLSISRNFSRKIALQLFAFLCVYNLFLASALNWILNL